MVNLPPWQVARTCMVFLLGVGLVTNIVAHYIFRITWHRLVSTYVMQRYVQSIFTIVNCTGMTGFSNSFIGTLSNTFHAALRCFVLTLLYIVRAIIKGWFMVIILPVLVWERSIS